VRTGIRAKKMLMFCPNCGKQVEENGAFCPSCGTALSQTAAAPAEQPVQQAQTQPVNGVPMAAPQDPAVVPGPETKPAKPRRKIWKKVLVACSCLLIVALVAVTVLQWNWIKGTSVKLFGSNEDYFAYVQKNSIQDGTESMSKIYGSLLSDYASGQASEADVKMNFGPMLNAAAAGSGIDLSALDEITLKMKSNVKDGVNEALCTVNLGDTELCTLHVISDLENGAVYVGLPGLHDTYVKMEVPDLDVEAGMAEMEAVMAQLEDLLAELPSEESSGIL